MSLPMFARSAAVMGNLRGRQEPGMHAKNALDPSESAALEVLSRAGRDTPRGAAMVSLAR